MFSRILVAIDGSQISMNAANYALSIVSKHHNSELTLLHVIPSEVKLGHASGMLGVVTPNFKEKVKQEAAENKHIDLIVVGTRGISGFKKLLLGRVASGGNLCALSCTGSKIV
jgi:nucleotide-binding universal stress UspA family protein